MCSHRAKCADEDSCAKPALPPHIRERAGGASPEGRRDGAAQPRPCHLSHEGAGGIPTPARAWDRRMSEGTPLRGLRHRRRGDHAASAVLRRAAAGDRGRGGAAGHALRPLRHQPPPGGAARRPRQRAGRRLAAGAGAGAPGRSGGGGASAGARHAARLAARLPARGRRHALLRQQRGRASQPAARAERRDRRARHRGAPVAGGATGDRGAGVRAGDRHAHACGGGGAGGGGGTLSGALDRGRAAGGGAQQRALMALRRGGAAAVGTGREGRCDR